MWATAKKPWAFDNSASRGLRLNKKDIKAAMSIKICAAEGLFAPVLQNHLQIGELDRNHWETSFDKTYDVLSRNQVEEHWTIQN